MPRSERRSPSEFNLKWRTYERAFVSPVVIRGSELAEREGVIVQIQDKTSGRRGYGECAPLPQFGSESLESATSFLGGAFPDGQPGADIEMLLEVAPPATAFAIETALARALKSETKRMALPKVRSAALMTLSTDSAREIARLRVQGFRTFKLKVGRAGAKVECSWLQALLAHLQPGERLRIDPNQSWTVADSMIWKETLESAIEWIDFIEEPFPQSEVPGHHLRHYADMGIPVALDESLQGGADTIAKWQKAGWDGYWVVKPSLLGVSGIWKGLLLKRPDRVVISSAYETGIGLSLLIELASDFGEIDHGLGTQAAFADNYGCPQNGAEMKALGPSGYEQIWNLCGGD